jgi:hypothetical protein
VERLRFAPKVFQHHAECIHRSIKENISPRDGKLSSILKDMSAEPTTAPIFSMLAIRLSIADDRVRALQGLEKVIGIPSDIVKVLMDCLPEYSRGCFKDPLMTYKDVKRGRDVFIPSLGQYDIMAEYERISSKMRETYVCNILGYMKRRTCHNIPPKPVENKKTDVINWLSKYHALDMIKVVTQDQHDLETILLKSHSNKRMTFVRNAYWERRSKAFLARQCSRAASQCIFSQSLTSRSNSSAI